VMPRVSFCLLFMIIVLSCHRPGPNESGKSVFRYNEASGISSLDPAYSKDLANIWPCNLIYNRLIELNDRLEPVPSIAKNWEVSADGLTYTFHLRDDVFFHDHPLFQGGKGRKVVASDVEYSFRRIVDPRTASPGSWVFSKVDTSGGSMAFSAMDDSTFLIRLAEPFPAFPGILAMKYCSVVPREIAGHYGSDFRKNPVGTGPFQLKLWKEGVKMVLVKNEHYFEFEEGVRLPYLDAVAITFQIDRQSAFLEFVKGNLDFISGIDPAYKDEVLAKDGQLREKYSGKFSLLTTPYLNTEYLGMLVDTELEAARSSPLRIKAVRLAMNYAIDRKKMVMHLRNNLLTPAFYGILPPGLKAYDTTGICYDYDPVKARQLLSEAGFPSGKGLPAISLYTTSDYLDLFKFLQYQYQEVGIKVNIEVTPYATLKELKAQAKVSFFRASWIADYPDEENYLSLFCSWNFAPAGPNYTHFSSPEYDRIYRESQVTPDDSVRLACYKRMNQIIMEEVPVVILYYDKVVRLVSNNVEGLGINPLNMLNLTKVKKSPQNETVKSL
jgi:oligopeptide transport system substrate-binding protein